MKEKKIIYKNYRGQKIVGLLIDNGKDFIVIHCHGYGTNKASKTATSLGEALDKLGMSFCRFDFSGFGESDGKEKDVRVSNAIDDLKSTIKYLKTIGFTNFGLSGSSFGGGVVLNYIADNHEIKVAVLKAPVSDYPDLPPEVLEDTEKDDDFLRDAALYTIYPKAKNIKCPVLILHGDKDTDIPLEQSQRTCSIIKGCKLIVVPGADHKFSDHKSIWATESAEFFKENR